MKKIKVPWILFCFPFLLVGSGCRGKIENPIRKYQNPLLNCLKSNDQKRGKVVIKEGTDFSIEFPEDWLVNLTHDNGLSASDTSANPDNFKVVGITEFIDEKSDFEESYVRMTQALNSSKKSIYADNQTKVLDAGITKIGRFEAKWMLVEDETLKRTSGDHARIIYMFPVDSSNRYFIIYNEAYGTQKFDDLCVLKKITNTFKIVE